MQKSEHQTYTFDKFTLDLTRGCLFRDSVEIKLRPKAFDVLKFLVANGGRLIGKDEIIAAVWKGTAVTDDSLVQCMKDIRRALGDEGASIIRTVPSRGYIFECEASGNGASVYFEESSGIHLVIEEARGAPGADGSVATDQSARPSSLIAKVRQNNWKAVFAAGTIALCAGAVAFALFTFFSPRPAPRFRTVSIQPITTDDHALNTVISPDGNYIVYTIRENEGESLWVRQVADVNPKSLAPKNSIGYQGLVFSPNSSFVYYVQGEMLYKIPVLGGEPRKVRDSIKGTVTFSPDGKRLALVRENRDSGEQELVVADADGSGDDRILAVRKHPAFFALEMFGTGPAWSPNGAVIACPAGDNGGFGQAYPLEVSVADGSQRPMTEKRWNAVVQVAWLGDGSGLLMNAKDNGIDATRQIWHISYPAGEPQRIYSDLMEYDRISFSARADLLASIQREVNSNIWAVHVDGLATLPKQITSGTGRQDGYWGMDTTPEGKVIFDSRVGGPRDLWSIASDGGDLRQITDDDLFEAFVKVSPDGRRILFHLGGKGLWIIDSDGGNRTQLTNEGMFPEFSRDGDWVFYALPQQKWSMWKKSTGGGEPVRVVDQFAVHPAISPDGRMVAYSEGSPATEPGIKILSLDNGEMLREFPLTQPPGPVKWTVDGKSLTYRQLTDGSEQIVTQSLDGDERRVLFTAASKLDRFRGFAWSRDGKILFVSVGPVKKNVVLFTLDM